MHLLCGLQLACLHSAIRLLASMPSTAGSGGSAHGWLPLGTAFGLQKGDVCIVCFEPLHIAVCFWHCSLTAEGSSRIPFTGVLCRSQSM